MGAVDPMSCGAVLVVDDDEDLRAELRSALEAADYLVIEAQNGKDALDLLNSRTGRVVGLVVLDLVMPCVTGWEVMEVLRRDPPLSHVPVLIASGTPVHGDASGIGATMRWLRKPFDEKDFLDAVRETIRSAQVLDEYDDDGGMRASLPSHHDA